jgi:hypothetical protein
MEHLFSFFQLSDSLTQKSVGTGATSTVQVFETMPHGKSTSS